MGGDKYNSTYFLEALCEPLPVGPGRRLDPHNSRKKQGWTRTLKAITMTWKKSTPPSLSFWKHLLYTSLPLYKDTYINQGCPKKYYWI